MKTFDVFSMKLALSRFNRFFHSAVLTDLFNKSYKLQFENLIDTRTNQLFTIEKYEDYQDMDDLKQLLKVLNLDYAVDEKKDRKISTKDIENKALRQHIEFCIQVGIWSGIELGFVQEEWERLIKNYKD